MKSEEKTWRQLEGRSWTRMERPYEAVESLDASNCLRIATLFCHSADSTGDPPTELMQILSPWNRQRIRFLRDDTDEGGWLAIFAGLGSQEVEQWATGIGLDGLQGPLYKRNTDREMIARFGFPGLNFGCCYCFDKDELGRRIAAGPQWFLHEVDVCLAFKDYTNEYHNSVQSALRVNQWQAMSDSDDSADEEYYRRYADVVPELDQDESNADVALAETGESAPTTDSRHSHRPIKNSVPPRASCNAKIEPESLERHIKQTLASLAEISHAAGMSRSTYEGLVHNSMVHGNALVWTK